jgi:23S rRNA G2445 N2-methylase RlmL
MTVDHPSETPDASRRFVVSSAPGLESLLADELREFGLSPTVEPSGAVALSAGWKEASRVLIRSRIAGRVALSLRRFASRSPAMLYDQVRRIDWPDVFSPDLTFSIGAHGSMDGTGVVRSFAPVKIKDAICDEFRKRGHLRPNVDRTNPDVRLNAFFFRGRCELSIDLAGQALHRRGYRQDGAEAPLRENRAAALLLFCGYDDSRPLVDPFCGSGTIPIEASLIATRTAPGLLRDINSYSLVRLFPETEVVLREEHRLAADEQRGAPEHPIRGSDVSDSALATARANAKRAGAAGWLTFQQGDARSVRAVDSWIVTNPPHGERLENPEAGAALLREVVHRIKHACRGSQLGLVVPTGLLEKSVGLRPDKRLAVQSGPLRLRYLSYAIRSGRFVRPR